MREGFALISVKMKFQQFVLIEGNIQFIVQILPNHKKLTDLLGSFLVSSCNNIS